MKAKTIEIPQCTKDIIFGKSCDLITAMKLAMKEVINQCDEDSKEFKTILDAYNRWQEEEKSCVDYVYDLDNKEDFVSLINGGMTMDDVVRLGEDFKELGGNKRFLLMNLDSEDVYAPWSFSQVREMIKSNNEFIVCVFCFVGRVDEYRDLFELLVTNHIWEKM